MNVLEMIRTADPKTRVSFLSPDKRAEDICDIQALRMAIDAAVAQALIRHDHTAQVAVSNVMIPASSTINLECSK